MQIKTLNRPFLATVLASALLFSCADKEKKSATEVTTDTLITAPHMPADTNTMDTGVVKPVVPTAPK
jgi:hypothetical protein